MELEFLNFRIIQSEYGILMDHTKYICQHMDTLARMRK